MSHEEKTFITLMPEANLIKHRQYFLLIIKILIAVSIISVYNVGSGSWLILKIKEKSKISVIFDHGVHQIKDKMSVVNKNKNNKIF